MNLPSAPWWLTALQCEHHQDDVGPPSNMNMWCGSGCGHPAPFLDDNKLPICPKHFARLGWYREVTSVIDKKLFPHATARMVWWLMYEVDCCDTVSDAIISANQAESFDETRNW